jgi:hypothetical protein
MKRGRPKGYSPYIDIRYEELSDWVGKKTKIPVSKKWLEALMGESVDSPALTASPKKSLEKDARIEYTITQL